MPMIYLSPGVFLGLSPESPVIQCWPSLTLSTITEDSISVCRDVLVLG